MKKKLITTVQDKGGIGKSRSTIILSELLNYHEMDFIGYDLDNKNSTYSRLYPSAQFIDTSVEPEKLDDIINIGLEEKDIVLVDNKATGGSQILAWMEDIRLLEIADQLDLEIFFLIIANDDKDSISQAKDAYEKFSDKENINWIILKVMKDRTNFPLWESTKLNKDLEKAGAITVEFPNITSNVMKILEENNIFVFEGAGEDSSLQTIPRMRCKTIKERVISEFQPIIDLLENE